MTDIHALAAQAAADTGLTISRIRPSPRTPVRPSSRVANLREWQQRYACDELREDDPPPIAQPGAYMLYVAASAFGAVTLEKWLRARGIMAFGGHLQECYVQL